jgi:2-keto-4-pentenoate hydratase/2-oxohepta-3-ene-1,7-dioic acid hydratase in catechol pathway
LVLKICTSGKNINIQNANEYFNEITVGIDFTARDIQAQLKNKGLPWEKAKAWDGSAVVGNWTSLTKEMLTNTINFSMTKNNTVVQKGNNSEMLFSFDAIIADISTYFSIEEGDLIFTGTPAGVGACVTGDILEGFLGSEKVFTVTIQ